MGVVLALLAALGYGFSDFAAGLGSRRSNPAAVTAIVEPLGLATATLAVLVLPAHSPAPHVLWWGALSGVGSGVGTVALYRGLAVARMSVVAPLSAVLSAALPALAGFLLGEHLAPLTWTGIALAMPAVALVSVQPADHHGSRRSGIVLGLIAGAGFALLFIALARAGTSDGAWPLLPGQAVAVVLVLGWAAPRRNRPDRKDWSRAWRPALAAGVVGGAANLLYLAATGAGQLAIVAVVTALYPAATVLLARLALHERWTRLQIVGLIASAVAVAAIGTG